MEQNNINSAWFEIGRPQRITINEETGECIIFKTVIPRDKHAKHAFYFASFGIFLIKGLNLFYQKAYGEDPIPITTSRDCSANRDNEIIWRIGAHMPDFDPQYHGSRAGKQPFFLVTQAVVNIDPKNGLPILQVRGFEVLEVRDGFCKPGAAIQSINISIADINPAPRDINSRPTKRRARDLLAHLMTPIGRLVGQIKGYRPTNDA